MNRCLVYLAGTQGTKADARSLTMRDADQMMVDMPEPEDLSVQILKQIREELVGTNRRVDALRAEATEQVESLRTQVTQRLDHLAQGQVRIATEVSGLRGEVSGLRGEVSGLRGEVQDLRADVTRQADRLENAIKTGGAVIRDLRDRVQRLEQHTGLDPV